MPITHLHFTNVGPFDDIEFEFDPRVNVFTGPNNSGKSTVLWVLGEIVVFPFAFPQKLLRENDAKFDIYIRLAQQVSDYSGLLPIGHRMQQPLQMTLPGLRSAIVSSMEFWDQQKWAHHVGLLEAIGYSSFIPALRQSTDFRSEGPTTQQRARTSGERPRREEAEGFLRTVSIPPGATRGMTAPQRNAYAHALAMLGQEEENPELRKRRPLASTNASLVSDEAVMQKIIDLDYAAYRRHQPAIRSIIERIAAIASEITEGFPIQFLGVSEDERGLYPQFRTPDGDIPLNVLSQGTQSIIQWLAHLLIGYAEYYNYPPDLEEKPGILIIDEIDAHLHPSWQRRIIPTLTKHFPNLQIFCSTHSPLMLAGLKAGQVQLLRRDEKCKVTVSRNESDIVGWSADEILRSFLDVPSPTDLETVRNIERLQELRRKDGLSADEKEELEQLRRTVNQDLISGPIASQLERFTELLAQAKLGPPPKSEVRTTRRRKPAQ